MPASLMRRRASAADDVGLVPICSVPDRSTRRARIVGRDIVAFEPLGSNYLKDSLYSLSRIIDVEYDVRLGVGAEVQTEVPCTFHKARLPRKSQHTALVISSRYHDRGILHQGVTLFHGYTAFRCRE